MTRFTHIVSTASKPLRGRLNHSVTMMGNQVMMTVIHTQGGIFLLIRNWQVRLNYALMEEFSVYIWK